VGGAPRGTRGLGAARPRARQLRWLIGIRLVVITSILLPYFLNNLPAAAPGEPRAPAVVGPPAPTTLPAPAEGALPTQGPAPASGLAAHTLYTLAGLIYLASLIYILLLRLLRGRHPLQAYVQFLGDLLLITALVYFTGGVASPFSIFYLVVIAVASTLLRRRAGFIVATAAYLLYAGLLLTLYSGSLAAAHPVEPTAGSVPFRLVYNLVVNLFAFYAVAILTNMLAHRITRAERELEEKREDLADLQVVHRDVIQSINSGLITTDLDGVITSVNRAGEEILGKTEPELVGRPIGDVGLLPTERWWQLTRPSSPSHRLRSDAELERSDGTRLYVGFSVSPLSDADSTPRGDIVIFQDLTRWRELQEEVRLKDRMAAVGELAAGLAHEIGNPLAAISGSVQMLARSTGTAGADRKLVDILLKESQRLDRTIKGFLRFARPRERATVLFDIAQLLAENFELLRNSEEVTARHELAIDLDPPSARLIADPDQVSQIFWNLARNALKAMPGGGTLRVSGRLEDDFYRIRFTDTGHGMAIEEKANLFHPFKSFFDSGSGIGMAIVYRIVQDHRGEVKVDSQPGAGTTITVELPVAGGGRAIGPAGGPEVAEAMP
jgi:two-component system sensor histidine kinase PilS (NtrC family)